MKCETSILTESDSFVRLGGAEGYARLTSRVTEKMTVLAWVKASELVDYMSVLGAFTIVPYCDYHVPKTLALTPRFRSTAYEGDPLLN